MKRAVDHLPMLPAVGYADMVRQAREQAERQAPAGEPIAFARRGDGLDWARSIRARIASGESMPAISRKLADEALEHADRVERAAEEQAQADAQYAAIVASREPGADEVERDIPAGEACSVCGIPMSFSAGQWHCYACEADAFGERDQEHLSE